jgi:DNA polymerase-1
MITQLPFEFMLPETNWTPPLQLPQFHENEELALDTENHDPELTSKGPAHLRGQGHVAGISLSNGTKSVYLPIGHQGGGNLDKGIVRAYLLDLFRTPRTWIVANGQYDLGWLHTLGLRPQGYIWDIQLADALLNEERLDGYSLEAIGKRWLGSGKDEKVLREAASAFGFRPKEDMWRLHSRFVGTYAEVDALRTWQIKQHQYPQIKAEDLMAAMNLEAKLVPIMTDMTLRGIRIDTPYAEELNRRWMLEETSLLGQLKLNQNDIFMPDVVAHICKQAGVAPLKTEKGNDSFGKDYLSAVNDPTLNLLLKVRAINRTRGIYLEQNLLINPYQGRLHPQYIQMASDEGGTRTYRFSCKNPNAQQFPKRSRLFDAKAIRKCLIPEEGCQWAKLDYWSQEPVLQNHYALLAGLPGAEEVRDAFAQGIKLYTFVAEKTGGRCTYDQCKEIVLGRSYGMGKAKMASRMNMAVSECDEVLTAFDEIVPYVKLLARSVSNRAQDRGYIKTLLGYRRRFNLWVPRTSYGEEREFHRPLILENAQQMWPNKPLERAGTHKAFNALIQGGSANQAKLAVVTAVEAGIMPTLLVHDEINSGNITSEAQARQLKEIMEHCIELKSPARADLDLGSTWQ